MQVTSDGLGKGATFTIELPLFALPESVILYNDDSSQAIHDSTIEPKFISPHRILIIDDANSNRKLLMRILKNKGYECEEAQDGEKGVAKYQEMCARGTPPDAILSDYEMPVMIGPHAVRHIRELGCRCFIVGVTGNVMQSDIDCFKAHGADAVLAKPLNTDTFESLFQQFLQKSAVNSPRYLVKDETEVQVLGGSSSHEQHKVLPYDENKLQDSTVL
jgi:CheY-like chemotaxis protein